jgi:protein AroM
VSRTRIAAVTIGEAPRPDLVGPLLARTGADIEIVEIGALDGVEPAALPARPAPGTTPDAGAYPLTTRMRDGTRVTLDEADLAPLVQAAIDRAEAAGAEVTLLLCAGGFSDVNAGNTLVRPVEAAVGQLRELGAERVIVIVPYPAQAEAARRKWEAEGFQATVLVGDPATIEVPERARGAIVLDYVGHATGDVRALRERTSVPVIDLGEAGADAAVLAVRRDAAEFARP